MRQQTGEVREMATLQDKTALVTGDDAGDGSALCAKARKRSRPT